MAILAPFIPKGVQKLAAEEDFFPIWTLLLGMPCFSAEAADDLLTSAMLINVLIFLALVTSGRSQIVRNAAIRIVDLDERGKMIAFGVV